MFHEISETSLFKSIDAIFTSRSRIHVLQKCLNLRTNW